MPLQPSPVPPSEVFGVAALLKSIIPYAGSALVGFVASNMAIGKRFDKAVGELKDTIAKRDKAIDERMARMEAAMFGPTGDGGIGATMASMGERMETDHDLLIRLATTVDGLRDTVRAVDTSVRAALSARQHPGATP